VTGAFVLHALRAREARLASTLHSEAFAPWGERGWTPVEIGDLLASPGVAGMLVQEGTAMIGFALCRTVEDEAELLTVAVRADCRRRGAGRVLMGKVVDHAREHGARSLFLEVADDNAAALALYEHLGFRRVGRRAAYYSRSGRPSADAIVMRLGLA
jgi:ribosomal-protein-alanine N-acetyltransferase